MPETIEEFAQRVKKKYPEYGSVSDLELAHRVLAKYPEYKSQIGGALPGLPGVKEQPLSPTESRTLEAGSTLKEAGKETFQFGKEAYQDIGKVAKGGLETANKLAAGKEVLPHPVNLPGLAREMVAGPVRELAGKPQPGESALLAPKDLMDRITGAASRALGGDPSKARENLMRGQKGAALADLIAVPIAAVGVGKVLGMAESKVPIAPSRQEMAAVDMIMGKQVLPGNPVESAERAANLQTILKQAAEEIGVTDVTAKGKLPGFDLLSPQSDYVGKLRRGNKVALDLASKAAEISDRPLRMLINTYANEKVPQVSQTIANNLRQAALDQVDDRIASALNKIADKVEKEDTVGGLNDFKSNYNKQINALYKVGPPGKAINASAETAFAYKLAADEIRSQLYPELQRLSGTPIDLGKYGSREADAIAFRDGMYDFYYRNVAPKQASRDALKFGEYVLGEGPEHSLYSRQILKRGLEKSQVLNQPAGAFNRITRRAIGPIGEGAVPEKVTMTPGQPRPSVSVTPGKRGLKSPETAGRRFGASFGAARASQLPPLTQPDTDK